MLHSPTCVGTPRVARLLWCGLLFLTTKALALDIVGPLSINSPVTWEVADSPVNVRNMVNIESGGVLTIAAGVTVIFEDFSAGISNSAGILLILGESNNRVHLQPSSGSDTNWRGISFGAGAVSAFFDLDGSDSTYNGGSVIQHADISRAGSSSSGALDLREGAAPYLLGVDIVECDGPSGYPLFVSRLQGFFVSKFLRVRNFFTGSNFRQNYGMRIDGSSTANGIAILENVQVDYVFQNALYVRNIAQLNVKESVLNGFVQFQTVREVSFVENQVVPTRQGTALYAYFIGGDGKSHIFKGNTIQAWQTGTNYAFYAYYWSESDQEHIIEDNIFLNGRLYYFTPYLQRLFLSNNVIRGSRFGGVILRASGRQQGEVVVANNTVQDCFSQQYELVSLEAYENALAFEDNHVLDSTGSRIIYVRGPRDYKTSDVFFRYNTVNNCTTTGDMILFDNFPFTQFTRNVFVNSTAQMAVSLGNSIQLADGDTLLSLPANYWGVFQEDVVELRRQVQDGLRKDVSVVVEFESILIEPTVTSVVQNISLPGPFLSDGTVGGYVSSGTVVLSEGTDYVASLSLFITGAASLSIEPGVSVSFAAETFLKLVGDGPFSIQGNATAPIYLRSQGEAEWGGLVLESGEDFSISYLSIEYAEIGIDHKGTGGLLISMSSIVGSTTSSASSSCIKSSEYHPTWTSPNNNITIHRTLVSNCGGNSISLNYRAFVRVSGCSVEGGNNGIYMGTSTRSVEIVENSIENFVGYAAVLASGSSSANIAVIGNNISSTDLNAGGLYLYCNSCTTTVANNRMVGPGNADISTSFNYPFYCFQVSSRGLYVGFNEFSGWNLRRPCAYIYFSASFANAGLDMEGNRFSEILAPNILDLQYASTRRGYNVQNDFGPGLEATSTTSPALFLVRDWPQVSSSYSLPTLKGTLFTGDLRNDTEQYYIAVLDSADSTPEIDISESYWNTDDVAVIAAAISDGADTLGLSILNYNPFLSALDGELINGTIPFVRPGNILGGTLEEGDTVILSAGNYSLETSLNIKGQLVLEPGTVLKFPEGVGLLVRSGALIAHGTVEQPIVFDRLTPGLRWSQVSIGPGTSSQGEIVMENVLIQGAGFSNVPALETERGGNYTNVTIRDCSAGGVQAQVNGDSLFFDGLNSVETSSSLSYPNIRLAGSGVVTIQDALLSSGGSAEIYASGSLSVFLDGTRLSPRNERTEGLDMQNIFTEVDSLSFDYSFLPSNSFRSGYPIYVRNTRADFTLRNSHIEVGNLRNADILQYYGPFSGASLVVENTVFVGIVGVVSRIIYATSARDATLINNTFSDIETLNDAVYVYGSGDVVVDGNSFRDAICGRNCVNLPSQNALVQNNSFVDAEVKNLNSLLRITRANNPRILTNRFEECKGNNLFSFDDASIVGFEDNAVVNITQLDTLVATTTPYSQVEGGVYVFGTNYWGTVDFALLRAKTADSSKDASVATIQYPRIYIDEKLGASIASPPPGAILNLADNTVGGSILDGSIVRIPSGLFLALSPIILNHPQAELVLEAGARIMFVESATIDVRQGTLKVLGTQESPVELVSTDVYLEEYVSSMPIEISTRWGGIRFGTDTVSSSFLDTQYVDGSIIQHCRIQNAGYSPLRAAVMLDTTSVLLEHVDIDSSGGDGVYISGTTSATDDLVLRRVVVTNADDSGLALSNAFNSLVLSDVNITGSGYRGVSLQSHGNVRITDSHFSFNNGEQIASASGRGYLNVSSSFAGDALQQYGLSVPSSRSPGLFVSIWNTEFARLKRPLYLNGRTYQEEGAEIVLCTFQSCVCSDAGCNSIDLRTYKSIDFRGNHIEGNVASTIARFIGYDTFYFHGQEDDEPRVSIGGNIFRGNRAATGTSGGFAVLSLVPTDGPSSTWDVQGNEFSNPLSLLEITLADYSGNSPETIGINGTNNLFSFAPNPSQVDVEQRIFNSPDDASLPTFLFTPFLSSDYVPSCVSNCTGRGTCTFPGFCICEPGWGGESCVIPNCQDIGFCSGRGECIDFDTCDCQTGWLGDSCSLADCSERNQCNGKGICNVPNTCSCETGYAGTDCENCVESYRRVGNDCLPCPICLNAGFCDPLAPVCICPENFAGDRCEACAPGYFGLACQPLVFVAAVVPNDSPDTGSSTILVRGVNFGAANSTKTVACNFSPFGTTSGSFIGDDQIACPSPSVSLNQATRTIQFRVTIDGSLSFNSLPFTFYGMCPDGTCLNGFCSAGRCQCFYGWTGEACDEQLVAPVVEAPPNQIEVDEGTAFSYIFRLTEGTSPVEWYIVGSTRPDGLSVNRTTGELSWAHPVPRNDAYEIDIRATNVFASVIERITLQINPSYIVEVSTAVSVRRRPSPEIIFDIKTLDKVTLDPVPNTLANLWVRKDTGNNRRKVLVRTGPSGAFSRAYLPYGTDAGFFVYGGEHPNFSNTTFQGNFSIRGVDVSPSSYTFRGFPNENATLSDLFSFTFLGGSFTGLTVDVDTYGETALDLDARLSSTSANSTDPIVSLSLDVLAHVQLAQSVGLTMKSNEGDELLFDLFVDVRDRTPRFKVAPVTLDVFVPRNGQPRFEDVVLENIGSRASGPIQILLPDQPIMRSVAGDNVAGLDVDEQRTVGFVFTATPDMRLGSFYTGTVVFVADDASLVLNFRATIVSTVPVSLTVITLNEASYFAPGTPNLANATVTVRSLTSGQSFTTSSGNNGNVTFPDLVEGLYEIRAQKLKHQPFRNEIYLESPGQTILAFLQTEVVSYTFSVVPVEVIDSYIIEVQATFETNVPAPVVVWEPAYLDWDSIQSGLLTEFEITGTNKGLVHLANVTLSWPRYDDLVEFILPEEPVDESGFFLNLGDLAANSTITVPIRVKPIQPIDAPEGQELVVRYGNNAMYGPPEDDRSWDTGALLTVIPEEASDDDWVYVKLGAEDEIEYIFDNQTATLYTPSEFDESGDFNDLTITDNAIAPFASRRLKRSQVKGRNERQLSCRPSSGNNMRRGGFGMAARNLCRIVRRGFIKGFVIGSICLAFVNALDGNPDTNNSRFPPRPPQAEGTIPCPPNPMQGMKWPRPRGGMGGGPKGPVGRCMGGIMGGRTGPPLPKSRYGDRGGGNSCRRGRRRRRLDTIDETRSVVSSHPEKTERDLQSDGCTECSQEDLKLVYEAVTTRESDLLEAETGLQVCISRARSTKGLSSLFPCALEASISVFDIVPLADSVLTCYLDYASCTGDISDKPGLRNLLIQGNRFKSLIHMVSLPVGGRITEDLVPSLNETYALSASQIEQLSAALVQGISDASVNGRAISQTELDPLLQSGFDSSRSSIIRRFAQAWNRSVEFWDNGIIDSKNLPDDYTGDFLDLLVADSAVDDFESDRRVISGEGFSGYGDALRKAIEGQQFEEARLLAGVCANVRISIQQELTLTRIGFEARLEVSNDGSFPLEDISVSLRINPFENITEDATSLFVIDSAELDGITDIDGSGSLGAQTSGRATWLMIPLTEAAPIFDTEYEVSGILIYTIDGVEYIQNLAPDTITVKPDPQLYLKYFHSRVSFSDDPFTGEIEPAIPFFLAILIENKGYGEARNLKIASSQPEIVENEKGLLVDFSIIGARFGNQPTANSLNINFGNIPAQSNAIGVWDMISTLRGTFRNFSATFEYNGPIDDDDRLSLIESVEIYELNHLVRITGDHPALGSNGLGYTDDGLDDFLVNLRPDAFYVPDTVFSSDTRAGNYSVSTVLDKARVGDPMHNIFDDDRVNVDVVFNLTFAELANLNDWVYIRFDDPMARTDYILQAVVRTDFDYTLIGQSNAWQTSWTDYLVGGEVEKLDYIHLFDVGVAPMYRLEYGRQQPVDNLSIVEATEDSLAISWQNVAGASSSYVVVKPTGYGDEYNQVSKEFTQTESHTIKNLQSGTSYTITVYTGRDGNYERLGARVTGSTLGTSTCGNNIVNNREECDDGVENGSTTSNCTEVCIFFRDTLPTTIPSSSPTTSSEYPSSSPSTFPSETVMTSVTPTETTDESPTVSAYPSPLPSTGNPNVSLFPSMLPLLTPSASMQPTPNESVETKMPTNAPFAVPQSNSPTTSLSPSILPSFESGLSLRPTPVEATETQKPANKPTWSPSNSATASVVPSVLPSLVPIASEKPTPTRPVEIEQPTNMPSSRPSDSLQPTDRTATSTPANDPTGQPSAHPSSMPSSSPSNFPLETPTSEPTAAPVPTDTSFPSPLPSPAPSDPPVAVSACPGDCLTGSWVYKMRDVDGEQQCDIRCASGFQLRLLLNQLGFAEGCCPPGVEMIVNGGIRNLRGA